MDDITEKIENIIDAIGIDKFLQQVVDIIKNKPDILGRTAQQVKNIRAAGEIHNLFITNNINPIDFLWRLSQPY